MTKKIKLVLSGGGTRYPCQVGGIMRLAEAGYEIVEIAGTSCGAIVAAGIGSGYKPNAEAVKLIKDTLPGKNKLVDASIFSLFTRWGLIKGDKFQELFSRYLVPTLGECKIPVHIITTDLDHGVSRVFSSAADPNMSLSLAVRASMAIPGVFAPVKHEGRIYVDGGLTSNFMLDIFGTGDDVIGFRFGSDTRTGGGLATPRKINSMSEYINANIETLLSSSENPYIADAMYARVVTLETRHGALNFGITDGDVEEMVKEGYNSVDRALQAGKI